MKQERAHANLGKYFCHNSFVPAIVGKVCNVEYVSIQVLLFDNQQQHVQITRRHHFGCHVGLLLSRVRLVVCPDCHVTSLNAVESAVQRHTPPNSEMSVA